MKKTKSLFLVQSDHLFPVESLKGHEQDLFLIIEDREHFARYRYHKHRLAFYLSAMRHYAHELRHHDLDVVYLELDEAKDFTYEKIVDRVLKEGSFNKIVSFEVEDKDRERRLKKFCDDRDYEIVFKKSPLFLTSREDFKLHLEQYSRPIFRTFYEDRRRKSKILMESNGEPTCGSYSFTEEERIRWSSQNSTPKIPLSTHDEIDHVVIKVIDKEFPDNPGQAMTFWYPSTRAGAKEFFADFLKYRLAEFGPYEEALCNKEDFLFHSALAPLLNVGLLSPAEVIQEAIQHSKEAPVPINSLESFVRQILGYREYAHGIYQNFSDFQEQGNFWKHHRLLNDNWFTGRTRIPPLDDALKKAERLSYNHHIERLKVICNMMNLAEIKPNDVLRWFMEMHMDSSPWSTEPNVYGLGLHSDGGIFTEKFHLCNSEDWMKISNYEKGDWCHEVDGLYWRFIDRHKEFFAKNTRLSEKAKSLDKISSEQRERLWKAADAFLIRNTAYP